MWRKLADRSSCRSYCSRCHYEIYDHCGHMKGVMRKIQLKDAKANLSAVVDQATQGKPSVITRHGKPEAVVLGFADWQKLSRVPSFGRLLMSAPLEPGDLPARNRTPIRDAGL
jgi:antitoxin Phd